MVSFLAALILMLVLLLVIHNLLPRLGLPDWAVAAFEIVLVLIAVLWAAETFGLVSQRLVLP